jgi:myosin heavy subunit
MTPGNTNHTFILTTNQHHPLLSSTSSISTAPTAVTPPMTTPVRTGSTMMRINNNMTSNTFSPNTTNTSLVEDYATLPYQTLDQILFQAQDAEYKLRVAKEKVQQYKLILSRQDEKLLQQSELILKHENLISNLSHTNKLLTQQLVDSNNNNAATSINNKNNQNSSLDEIDPTTTTTQSTTTSSPIQPTTATQISIDHLLHEFMSYKLSQSTQLSQMQTALTQLVTKADETQQIQDDLYQNQVQTTQSILDLHQSQQQQLQTSSEFITTINTTSNQSINNIETNYQSQVDSLTTQLTKAQDENKKLNDKIKQFETQLNSLQIQNQTLVDSNNQLHNQNNSLHQQLTTKIENKFNEVENLIQTAHQQRHDYFSQNDQRQQHHNDQQQIPNQQLNPIQIDILSKLQFLIDNQTTQHQFEQQLQSLETMQSQLTPILANTETIHQSN